MSSCLIVGGGVVGLSLAYELAVAGWSVRVLDRSEPGREASWAGAGILPPANSATAVHPLDQLRGLSCQLHAEWATRLRSETGIDTGYRRCGGIYVAGSVGEAAALHGLAAFLDDEQVRVEGLSLADVARWEPALEAPVRRGRVRAAIRLPDEAQLRNPRHLAALLAACRQRKVEVVEHAPVEDFSVVGDRLNAVVTPKGTWRADTYCVTSGAWTSRLLELLGVSVGILPIRGQMVLFAAPRPPLRQILNEGPRYVVPRDDGHVLVGSTEEEAAFEKETTVEGIAALTAFAYDLVPELRQAKIEGTWAGLRPGVYDGLPYLGEIPGLSNAFVAAGHFRSGLYLSPGTAVVMSARIAGRDSPIDLSPFRVSRG